MKKKPKKHRFTHVDPERLAVASKSKGEIKVKAHETENPQLRYIFRDLRGSVITIGFFVTLLVGVYLLETQFGILEKIKGIIG
ncbi:MAG: hypothetical protein PHW75_00690 [Patescibacteria group bacterium]|nr:hypothetical protein [Patescibacteria group bacterium]